MIKEIIRQIACAVCRVMGGMNDLGQPTSTADITAERLYQILRQKFPEGELFLSDSKDYRLCNLEDINRFLEQDLTNKMGYIAERRDCDDFSYRLMGQFSIPDWSDLAIGIVWTNLHALNCLIDQNEEFWFLEPQTDDLKQELEAWQGTRIRFIIL